MYLYHNIVFCIHKVIHSKLGKRDRQTVFCIHKVIHSNLVKRDIKFLEIASHLSLVKFMKSIVVQIEEKYFLKKPILCFFLED